MANKPRTRSRPMLPCFAAGMLERCLRVRGGRFILLVVKKKKGAALRRRIHHTSYQLEEGLSAEIPEIRWDVFLAGGAVHAHRCRRRTAGAVHKSWFRLDDSWTRAGCQEQEEGMVHSMRERQRASDMRVVFFHASQHSHRLSHQCDRQRLYGWQMPVRCTYVKSAGQ